MNLYVLWTNHGRKFLVNATYSFTAEEKAKPFLQNGERVSSWDIATREADQRNPDVKIP